MIRSLIFLRDEKEVDEAKNAQENSKLMYHDLQFEQHLHWVYKNQVERRIEMEPCQQQAI